MSFFVPGKLVNPLNNRKGWRAVWAVSKGWRERTAVIAGLSVPPRSPLRAQPSTPKRVTFQAQVSRRFDDDGLRAALKPVRDALMPSARSRSRRGYALGCGVIHSDAPDSGHEFLYEQVVDRQNPGVQITIELR